LGSIFEIPAVKRETLPSFTEFLNLEAFVPQQRGHRLRVAAGIPEGLPLRGCIAVDAHHHGIVLLGRQRCPEPEHQE
jgi:hypothetical protein